MGRRRMHDTPAFIAFAHHMRAHANKINKRQLRFCKLTFTYNSWAADLWHCTNVNYRQTRWGNEKSPSTAYVMADGGAYVHVPTLFTVYTDATITFSAARSSTSL